MSCGLCSPPGMIRSSLLFRGVPVPPVDVFSPGMVVLCPPDWDFHQVGRCFFPGMCDVCHLAGVSSIISVGFFSRNGPCKSPGWGILLIS